MNRHLTMRSGNPALSSKTFKNIEMFGTETMTIEGTVNKTSISLLLLILSASYTWINPSPGLMMLGVIGGFILALVTIFRSPSKAGSTAPLYSFSQGIFLGGVTMIFEASYPGIAIQAIGLTFGILASLLFCY